MQDGTEDDGHGPVRVNNRQDLGVCQHGRRIAQVGRDCEHTIVGSQQCPGMGQHDWIGVDVGDLGRWVDCPRDLVSVLYGRQARAQVEELADALARRPGNCLREEHPVFPDQVA